MENRHSRCWRNVTPAVGKLSLPRLANPHLASRSVDDPSAADECLCLGVVVGAVEEGVALVVADGYVAAVWREGCGLDVVQRCLGGGPVGKDAALAHLRVVVGCVDLGAVVWNR